MNGKVLFIQGGGDGGSGADRKLVASLQTALRKEYDAEVTHDPKGNKMKAK